MVLKWLRTLLCGICVGAADIVPGISGGTVAFIIGIYEELLASISSLNAKAALLLFKGKCKSFFQSVAWPFLTAFLLGVSISFLTLAKGFQYLLNSEDFRPLLYSLFMGLVVGSVIFCARLLPAFSCKSLIFLLLGAISAYLLSGADLTPKGSGPLYNVPITVSGQAAHNYDTDSKQLLSVTESQLAVMLAKKYIDDDLVIYNAATKQPHYVQDVVSSHCHSLLDFWVVACGIMAISAMLLPGISGSYLLNILGMYGFILGALVDWVEGLKMGFFDFGAFRICCSMGLGIAIGALAFARVVNYLLTHFRNVAIATLVGFMIGALKSVWPFWRLQPVLSPLHITQGPILEPVAPILPDMASLTFAYASLFFACGIGLVFLIEFLANQKKTEHASSYSRN